MKTVTYRAARGTTDGKAYHGDRTGGGADVLSELETGAVPSSSTRSRTEYGFRSSQAEVARAVALGLGTGRKRLPSWLLYDAAGSALFEQITLLPEYYLTRAEAENLRAPGDLIVAMRG